MRTATVVAISIVLNAEEVAVDGIEPAGIEMRVADDVNVDHFVVVGQFRTILNRASESVIVYASLLLHLPYTHSWSAQTKCRPSAEM